MGTSFNKLTASKDRVMVVDALNLAFRYKHSRASDFGADYIRTVQSLAQSYKCGKVVIAADKGSSWFRKEIYPEYKGNREEKYKTQTEVEKEEFLKFLDDYNKCLDMMRTVYPVLQFDRVEADDIGAWIAINAEKFGYSHVQLISSDRDWDLLISPTVSRFSYVTRKDITWDNWGTHYECTPEEYLTIKCLAGDSGDNIAGVEGMGPKRSLTIARTYGGILDIIDQLPIPGNQKFIKALNSSVELLERNFKLMDLATFCEDAIGEENLKVIAEALSI